MPAREPLQTASDQVCSARERQPGHLSTGEDSINSRGYRDAGVDIDAGAALIDNIPRVLPTGLAVEIDARAWQLAAEFAWLAEAGGLAPQELARTFNCCTGMVAITTPTDADASRRLLEGETVQRIGTVIRAPESGTRIIVGGVDQRWPS